MEECISVFDMLKIGVGPSSSHTLGPWRAAERFLVELTLEKVVHEVTRIKVDLYGSLSLTGIGHATDLAIMLGLSGQDPEYIPVENIDKIITSIKNNHQIHFRYDRPDKYCPLVGLEKEFLGQHNVPCQKHI